jgi:hypothetical protein
VPQPITLPHEVSFKIYGNYMPESLSPALEKGSKVYLYGLYPVVIM